MALYVILPCKSLVKQFIINRYGSPVVFPHNDWLRSMLIRYLERPDTEYEHKVGLIRYSQTINLPILMREYERFGNDLSKTSILHINQTVQDIIEEFLFIYIKFHHQQCGMLLHKTIEKFRIEYRFPEETFTTDAINKFWQRQVKKRTDFYNNITAETVLLRQIDPQKKQENAQTLA
jgi:hypothetical protein